MSAFLFARPVASHTIHVDAGPVAAGDPDAAHAHAADLAAPLSQFAPEDVVSTIRLKIADHVELGLTAVAEGTTPCAVLRLHADAEGAVTTVDENAPKANGLLVSVSAIHSDDHHDGVLDDWIAFGSSDSTIVMGRIDHDMKGRFPDGSVITTSKISTPTADLKPGAIVETMNSRYLLGRPAIAEAQSEDAED